jgi:1-acyl-sn-glycerol-3-phosphate acyltransferase
MRAKVLGNDPFARGAPARDALAEDPPPAALAEMLPPLPPIEPRQPTNVRRLPTAPPKTPKPTLAPAPEVQLAETLGTRLRHLLERQLPAAIEGVAKSWVEALGLTAQPVQVSDVDAFGLSSEFIDRWQPVLERVVQNYFRAEVTGLEKLPRDGPAMLVSNHSGILPYDEILLSVAVRSGTRRTGAPGLDVRALSEDFAINAPFAGSWLNRFGLVRASQDNAERLLQSGAIVAVFPEGAQGIGKLYRNRYRLQRFGRGGFIRLALRTQVPIFPVALIGGEEAQPVVARVRLPRPLKPPHLPLTPTFPWLGPLGLLPLPTHWRIQVGDPIVLAHSREDANNRALVASLSEDVRQKLQEMIDSLLRARKTVFL